MSFSLHVSLEKCEQTELFPTDAAAVRHLTAVDAAVSHEAGGQGEGLSTERACVRLLAGVCELVVAQHLLQTETLPTYNTRERFLSCVAALVNSELRMISELLPTVVADHDSRCIRQLMGVFTDDVVLQTPVALTTDGTELPLTCVDGLVAAQVGGLCTSLPACGTLVGLHLLVYQFVACQVAGMVEALPTYVADEGLIKMSDPVSLHQADTGVAFPTDVTVAALFTGVSRPNVQVVMSLVIESFAAEVAGVRQQPVLFYLVVTKPQRASKYFTTH